MAQAAEQAALGRRAHSVGTQAVAAGRLELAAGRQVVLADNPEEEEALAAD